MRFKYSTFLFLLLSLFIVGCTEKVKNDVLPKVIEAQSKKKQGKSESYFENDKGITVVTVGTGLMPITLDRAMAGTAIFVNGRFFMFDAGPRVTSRMELLNIPLAKLSGVFFTHFHSDHYLDLPTLINRSWFHGNPENIKVYGPKGVKRVVSGLNEFLAMDNHYRSEEQEKLDFNKSQAIAVEYELGTDDTHVVFNQDGIVITAFKVDHGHIEPAVGYAIEYNGKKVVLSGDTKKSAMVQKMAKNADILVHEAMLFSLFDEMEEIGKQNDIEIMPVSTDHMREHHTSPGEVAEIAKNANVKKLVLNHMIPSPDNVLLKRAYKDKMKTFEGSIILSKDGDVFNVE